MITEVTDKEALVDLLHDLNERGIVPVAGVLPHGIYGEPILVYGTDEGDEMGIAWFADPGDDAKWCEPSDEHRVYPERRFDQLPEGPYTVLHSGARPGETEPTDADPFYPDCPKRPHDVLDCPADSDEDHDPARPVSRGAGS